MLAGGLGTRLRAAVSDRPKALATVNGRPFLAYLLDDLVSAGVGRIVLCTGYLSEQVELQFGRDYLGTPLVYSPEPRPLGTAGALRYALPQLSTDPLLVLNGDSYCRCNLLDMLRWHHARSSYATLCLTQVSDPSRFGNVRIAEFGEVEAFEEKNASRQASPQHSCDHVWINAGIYLLAADVIRAIPEGQAISLERDVFPGLVGRGLHGYCGNGEFIDIGTPESYSQAEDFLATAVKR